MKLVFFGFVACSFFFGSCSKSEAGTSGEEAAQKEATSKPLTFPVSGVVAPRFDIVATEQGGPDDGQRLVRVVVTQNPVTKEEIQAATEKIVLGMQKDKPTEVRASYYFHPSQAYGRYTLAMAEWQVDNPKRIEVTMTKLAKRDPAAEPTEKEREVEVKFGKAFQAAGGEKLDTEIATELAPVLGMTPAEVLAIHEKVALYDMGI